MVASDGTGVVSEYEIDAFCRIGTIADQVTQRPDLVKSAPTFRILDDTLQCLEVAMNVSYIRACNDSPHLSA